MHPKKGKDFDIIYVTSAKLLTAFLGSLVSRYISKPLYIDFRDIFYDVIMDINIYIYAKTVDYLSGLVV